MGLHPSGSAREDVELVIIETKMLSLVIKGKPYHEKYEGLNQYRSMDFQDIMQFSVSGEKIEKVLVFDIERNELVENTQHRPVFFENTVYQIMVSPKNEKEQLSFHHEHPLLRNAVAPVKIGQTSVLMGNLQFQNEVGLSSFEIRSNNKKFLEVTLEIYPTKLDYKRDYQKLMDEVNDEIYNLAYHFVKKTYQGAKIKLDGQPSATEFYRLISVHFRTFLQAVKRIEQQPHHKLIKTHVKARGDQLQRLDSKGRSYLRKNANVFTETPTGISLHGKNVMPQEGLRMKKELTYDTLENRYVKWMIGRLTHKLEDLLERITAKRPMHDSDPDEELVKGIESMTGEIKGIQKKRFWKSIGRLDRSVMSLVLQMAPGYRDAYQLFLTVYKGLDLQGKIYQMSVKDVATLYEYWTYLKLGQLLSKKYIQVSQDIIKVNREGLFVNLDSNQSAKRVFRHPITNEKIILMYQKTGGRLPTTSQKPDAMLAIEKKGRNYHFNYVFDAKYRIDFALEGTYYGKRYETPGPLEEDINTMHRYRDSLVVQHDGPYERNAFGAYVLFPWGEEESYKQHSFYESINKVNIGGLPFLPNATDLVEQFVENLIDKSPEEIQKEGILPRGRTEEWRSSLEEKVLVGVVSSEEEYRQCMHEATYYLTTKNLRKGWQEAKYVALYLSKEVGFKNGVVCYGKINGVTFTQEERVRIRISVWEDLPQVIKPVNYGIANYVITTLDVLKEATELPEIFMKSKEEVAIWRMMRRVSDRVKVELDERELDIARRVQTFHIKDNIRMRVFSNAIELVRGNDIFQFVKEDLRETPTKVFKILLKVLEEKHV